VRGRGGAWAELLSGTGVCTHTLASAANNILSPRPPPPRPLPSSLSQAAHPSPPPPPAFLPCSLPQATLSPPSVTFDSRLRQKRHRTLAHRLSALGYRTGVAGLWHVGGPSLTGAKRDLERVKGVTRDAAEKAAAGGSR
jgi:hypothetical protein